MDVLIFLAGVVIGALVVLFSRRKPPVVEPFVVELPATSPEPVAPAPVAATYYDPIKRRPTRR